MQLTSILHVKDDSVINLFMDSDEKTSSGQPHKFDVANLRQMIYSSPSQFAEGFKLADGVKVEGNFESVVFSGEGGSAFPSQLLEIIVRDKLQKEGKAPFQIVTNHSYSLPAESFNKSLNICCSYSGNTEETISVLSEAIEKKLPVIGVASGGKVEGICKEHKVPFVKLPIPYVHFQPRIGTGYFVSVMLKILSNHRLISDVEEEILKSVPNLEKILPDLEKKGREIASKIVGKTPVVYASEKYARVAMVWKIKFNEHAKNPAFWNFFPELNHNEMVGFTNLGERYFLIMLRDGDDDPRNLKRYDVIGSVVKEKGLESVVVELDGENVFSKIFGSLYIADFTAYYLAEANQIDPTPVEMVEKFKGLLKS